MLTTGVAMYDLTEDEIVAFNCLEPLYVDGVAGMANLGTNFAILYFRWNMIVGGGHEKVPALKIIRPVSSIIACRSCFFKDAVSGLQPPRAGTEMH
jgi:hypothetical protein